jgi:putative drug exporter of the RND superfamily
MPVTTNAATGDAVRPRRGDACGAASVAVVEFCRGHAVLVVSACIAMAVVMNVFAPFWTAFTIGEREQATVGQSSLPHDRPAFPARFGNVAYVVVDSSAAPEPTADTYLDTLAERLRGAAPAGVRSVVSQSTDPLTAPIAQSDDNRVAYIDVELNGAPGSVEAISAVRAVRAIVRAVPAPAGVHSYVSGPGAASAAAAAKARGEAPWIALIVVGAMLALVIVVARSKVTSAMVLASAAVALLIALPVDALLASPAVLPTGPAMIVALTMGSSLHYARLMRGGYRQQYRRGLPSDAAVAATCRSSAPAVIASASILVFSLASVTIVDSAQLLGLGISIAVGAAVGVLLCYACATLWMPHVDAADHIRPTPTAARRLSQRLTVATYRHPNASLVLTAVIVVAAMAQLSRIDVVLTHPQAAPVNSEAALGYAAADEHFADDRLRPLSVVVRADHDLRNPVGLLAIDRVTRRLMELPAATRVQSAAWPAGIPLPQFTVDYQLGELNRQLQSEGLSAMSLTDSLHRLPAITGELTSTIDQFGKDLTASTAGLSSASTSLADLRSAMDRIQVTLSAMSSYADPVRRFIAANPDCAADTVCSLTQRVIQPIDSLLADTSRVVASTNTLPASTSAATHVLTSASSTLPQVRTNLAQFQALIDEFVKAIDGALPEATKVTSFLNTMTADLSNGGASGFYLPQSQIDAANYARVKTRMFSADGHATRILVYVSGIGPSDRDLGKSAVSAVRQSSKYGALAGDTVEIETLGSPEPMRVHRVSDLAAPLLLLAAVIALTTGVALRSAVTGVGVAGASLACVAAGLGAATLLASILPGRTDWSTPLLALLVTLPAVAEDGFQLARRWIGSRRRDQTTCALSNYPHGSALAIAAAIGAAIVTGATALTAAGLDYVGLAVMCCLALSYLCLRSWLIVAAASAPRVATLRAPGSARRERSISTMTQSPPAHRRR